MKQETIALLGVHFQNRSKKTVFSEIQNQIKSPKDFSYIVTPNPEIILKSIQSEKYWKALHHASYVAADGVGIQYGLLFWHQKRIPRITGVEITHHILSCISGMQKKLVIINRPDGLSSQEELLKYFTDNYPKLHVEVISTSAQEGFDGAIQKISKIKPDIIFSTLGAPHQEHILYKIKEQCNYPCLAIANGATLDFMLGNQKRAPKLMQTIGIEWLWRLFSKPKNTNINLLNRAKRIFNAVIKFPLTVIWWRLRTIFIYRYSNMGLIIQPANQQILIARFKEFNEWGIPKGGAERNESITEATKRELYEELNIQKDHLKFIAQQKNLYKYQWNAKRKSQRGYKGQKINATIFMYTGNPNTDISPDNFETDDFKWVPISELQQHVSESHQKNIPAIQKFIATYI